MNEILIEKPDTKKLEELEVDSWPIWEKEVSRFNWSYNEEEICFILEGKARVEPEEGEAVEFGPGDLVTFPKGMNCAWDITSPIRKHYRIG
ncbi:MAG: cupin domain-containing protein [Candidatus Omnitrophota bacterium]